MIGLELVRDGTATRLSVESADSGLTTTRRFSRADRLMILCKKAERPASPLTLICKRIRCTEKKVTTSTRVSFLPRPIAASGPNYPAYRLALLAPYRCWWRCRPRTGLQVDHLRRLETSIRSLLQQTCKVDTSLWSGDSVLNIFFRKAIFGQPATTPSAHGNRPTQATNPQVPTTRRWCEGSAAEDCRGKSTSALDNGFIRIARCCNTCGSNTRGRYTRAYSRPRRGRAH